MIDYERQAADAAHASYMATPSAAATMAKLYPDKVANLSDGWAVRFNGEIQSPRWLDKGPAEAFLDALQSGTRKHEPETMK